MLNQYLEGSRLRLPGSHVILSPTPRQTMIIQLKRVYDPASESDGCRVLVDRIWPRGIRKEKARINLWLKEVAPSAALRKWFGHDPSK